MPSFRRKAVVFASALSLCAGFLFSALPAAAVSLPPLVPPCAQREALVKDPKTPPSLNCALQTFGNIANIILGITGSFALLMFVYGGFVLLSSGGSQEAVTKGKTIIKNAVIGIVIILGSGYVITYGLDQLGVKAPIAGTECEGGVNVSTAEGVKCIIGCNTNKELQKGLTEDKFYKCMDVSQGTNCIAGLCPEGLSNQCCQPGAPASGGTTPPPAAPDRCSQRYVGFTCADITTRQGGGTGCYSNLCPGSTNVKCCPQAGQDTCQAAHPGYSCKNSTGISGCFSGLCPGAASIRCCP